MTVIKFMFKATVEPGYISSRCWLPYAGRKRSLYDFRIFVSAGIATTTRVLPGLGVFSVPRARVGSKNAPVSGLHLNLLLEAQDRAGLSENR